MKVHIELRDIIVFGLILLCLVFCLSLYWKVENLKLTNQVIQNTRDIQAIVNFLNGQTVKPQTQETEKK